MSLDSKHNKMKEFKRLLNNFKNLKLKKQETQLKKERIMKNVQKKYYNAYKNDYDADELGGDKKKKFGYKQFELFDKIHKKSALDEETKFFLKRSKIEKKLLIKRNLGNILATNLLHY